MPPKVWTTESLKTNLCNKNIISTCNNCRSAAISRVAEKKQEAIAKKRSLKEAKNRRRQCLRKWEIADQEVKNKRQDLRNTKAETARLQESIITLSSLPQKIDELVDFSFGGEMLIFGRMPSADKIFTWVFNNAVKMNYFFFLYYSFRLYTMMRSGQFPWAVAVACLVISCQDLRLKWF